MIDKLDLYRKGELEIGLGLGVPHLDSHIRFKKGNFNVLAGHGNVGKTFWILWYYTMLSVRYGLKFSIYSPENTNWVLRLYLTEFFSKSKADDLSEKDYQHAKAFVSEYFKFIDAKKQYELPQLLDVFSKQDVDCCLIDPHNSLDVPFGINRHEYDYKMASNIRAFCNQTNKTVYLNCHGVTEALRKTHPKASKGENMDLSGLIMPLQSADIEGGGKWVNRCDDLYIAHRYVQSPVFWNETHIHVRKVKVTQTGGSPTMYDTPCKFDINFGYQFNSIGTDVYESVKDVKSGDIPF